jgi:phosphohistidine swiveling domain-containing protein
MFISWLNEIDAGDIERAGGKGANLGEMTRAGFPVPPGFCILSNAYRAQLDAEWLKKTIAETIDGVKAMGGFGKASEKIRALVESLPVRSEIEAEIRAAYEKLSGQGFSRVAVRSSATAEDLPDASFAGQQETYLSIADADSLVESVRLCWSSAWTERACEYRQKMGYAHETLSLAVVVQAMVESEIAGVLFTADPMAPSKPAMLVNASYGLGESVVSPDNFLISKSSPLRVIDKIAGSKETMIRSLPGGKTETVAVPDGERGSFCLTRHNLKALKSLGLLVERHYGKPQDIEWAFEKGELWLLQARPITTFGLSPSSPKRKASASTRKVIDSLKEHCPDAILPSEFDLIVSLQQQKHDIMSALGLKMPRAGAIMTMDPDGLIELSPFAARPTLKILLIPFAIKKRLGRHTNEWAIKSLGPLLERRAEIGESDKRGMDGTELRSALIEMNGLIASQCEIRFWAQLFPMMAIGKFLNLRLRLSGLSKDFFETDLLGNLDYRSSIIEKDLYDLALLAESDPAVKGAILDSPPANIMNALPAIEGGDIFRRRFAEFLSRHGSRTPKTFLPYSNLSWAESPAELLASLGAIVRSGSASKRRSAMEASAKRYASLLEKMEKSIWGGKGFKRSLDRYRECFKEREAGLYEIETSFVIMRSLMKEAGRRLAGAGVLEESDDIRYLKFPETADAIKGDPAPGLRETVLRRKAGRARAIAEWKSSSAAMKRSAVLSGVPSSTGISVGRAKLIKSPSDFPKLENGDILVCPFTDPTWTPLFSLASAVIAETGGPLSHAAIVAREYSIPAVMGVSGALSLLKDGQNIRVDGSRGEVHIL